MSRIEFLILIPGLLIAMALAEIVIYVGKAARSKIRIYWELALLIFVSIEVLFSNWYHFYERIQFIHESYLSFLLINLVPISFFIYASILVPQNIVDNNVNDGKDHFLKNRSLIYTALSAFVGANLLTVFVLEVDDLQMLRLIIIPILGANIFIDSKYFRTGVMIFVIILRLWLIWQDALLS